MKYSRSFVITITVEYDTDEPSLPGSIPEGSTTEAYHRGAGEDLAMILLEGYEGSKHRVQKIDLWENRLSYKEVSGGLYRSERKQ